MRVSLGFWRSLRQGRRALLELWREGRILLGLLTSLQKGGRFPLGHWGRVLLRFWKGLQRGV